MAAWVLDLCPASGNTSGRVVAASGTDSYTAVLYDSPLVVEVVKVNAAGAVDWQQLFTPAGAESAGGAAIAAKGGYVALAISLPTSVAVDVFLLDESDGSTVWSTQLPFTLDVFTSVNWTGLIDVDSSGNVVVAGKNGSNNRVCKLAAADGSLTWAANPLPTEIGTDSNGARQIALLSTGDVAVSHVGPNFYTGVYLLATADGSQVWGRELEFPTGTDKAALAVDPSDNIYVAGMNASGGKLAIGKLDDTGALLWDSELDMSGSDTINFCGAARATADGVFVGGAYTGGSYTQPFVAFLDDAGATADGVAAVMKDTAYTDGVESLFIGSDAFYFTTYNTQSSQQRAVLYRVELGSYGATEFGGFERDAASFAVTAGSLAVTSPTMTGSSAPTVTPASAGSTVSSGALTETLYAEDLPGDDLIRFGYGALFSQNFGTPREAKAWPLTGIAPTAAFGTPALDYNLEPQAHGFQAAAQFGAPIVVQYLPNTSPRRASSLAPGTAFGTPALAGSYVATLAGIAPTTMFGTPTGRLGQEADGFLTGAFGTPTSASAFAASSFYTGAFGTPTASGVHAVQGIDVGARFGTPSADLETDAAAGGFTSTAFGTPTVTQLHLAAALLNRARFGTPRVVLEC